jgi:hypothetical protein
MALDRYGLPSCAPDDIEGKALRRMALAKLDKIENKNEYKNERKSEKAIELRFYRDKQIATKQQLNRLKFLESQGF